MTSFCVYCFNHWINNGTNGNDWSNCRRWQTTTKDRARVWLQIDSLPNVAGCVVTFARIFASSGHSVCSRQVCRYPLSWSDFRVAWALATWPPVLLPECLLWSWSWFACPLAYANLNGPLHQVSAFIAFCSNLELSRWQVIKENDNHFAQHLHSCCCCFCFTLGSSLASWNFQEVATTNLVVPPALVAENMLISNSVLWFNVNKKSTR